MDIRRLLAHQQKITRKFHVPSFEFNGPTFFLGCGIWPPPFYNPRMNPESICRHNLNFTAKLVFLGGKSRKYGKSIFSFSNDIFQRLFIFGRELNLNLNYLPNNKFLD